MRLLPKVGFAILLLCFVVVVLAFVRQLRQPPAWFRKQISVADRIEVQRFDSNSTIIVTGVEARTAAEALRHGVCIGHPMCAVSTRIKFYEGTNFLAEAGICVQELLIGDRWYQPTKSGRAIIRSWYDQLRAERANQTLQRTSLRAVAELDR